MHLFVLRITPLYSTVFCIALSVPHERGMSVHACTRSKVRGKHFLNIEVMPFNGKSLGSAWTGRLQPLSLVWHCGNDFFNLALF